MQTDIGLGRQILNDLISIGRLPLILLFLVLISALGVVVITQKTRTTVAYHDQLLLERERLEVEWRNQLLEEHALSEHTRVEMTARREQEMIRPDSNEEIIVSQ